jgi:hypothetical protein
MEDNAHPVGVRRRKPLRGRSEATGAMGSNPPPEIRHDLSLIHQKKLNLSIYAWGVAISTHVYRQNHRTVPTRASQKNRISIDDPAAETWRQQSRIRWTGTRRSISYYSH